MGDMVEHATATPRTNMHLLSGRRPAPGFPGTAAMRTTAATRYEHAGAEAEHRLRLSIRFYVL